MENPAAQDVSVVSKDTVHPASPHLPTQNNNRKKKTGIFAVIAAIILLAAIGMTVFLSQHSQDNRQDASSLGNAASVGACGPLSTDTILVFDRSNSMHQAASASAQALLNEDTYPSDDDTSTSSVDNPLFNVLKNNNNKNNKKSKDSSKLAKAKAAMAYYVSRLQGENNGSRVGLVSFGPKARTDIPITDQYSQVTSKINALKTSRGTCVACAIKEANSVMAKIQADPNRARGIILATDGRANLLNQGGKADKKATAKAEAQALQALDAGFQQNHTPYFVIGLGVNANTAFLQQIAAKTGGKYYFAPTDDDIQGIYTQIVNTLGRGKVTGQVFVDKNNNGKKDPGEELLPGWTVVLKPKASTSTQSTGNVSVQSNRNKKKHKNNKNNPTATVTTGVTVTGIHISVTSLPTLPVKANGKTLTCQPANIPNSPGGIVAQLKNKKGKSVDGKKVTFTASNPSDITFQPNKKKGNKGNVVKTNKKGIAKVVVNFKTGGTVKATSEGASCSVTLGKTTVTPSVTGGVTPNPSSPTATLTTTITPSGTGTQNPPGTLTAITDQNGTYTFSGVCGGDYELSLQPKPGFKVTVPPGNLYLVHMENGMSITDKDFGVIGSPIPTGGPTVPVPTHPSTTPGPTVPHPTGPTIPNPTGPTGSPSANVQLNVTLFMHGIGKSGDNANPFPAQCGGPGPGVSVQDVHETRCLSNQSPITPNRPMTVDILNTSNAAVANGTGTLAYNTGQGDFSGVINVNNKLAPGKYTVKITSVKYLTKTFPGPVTLTTGQNKLPVVAMVVGDSYAEGDSKNQLDIRDYNALIGCYTVNTPAKDCGFMPNQKSLTDLDDDGKVNDNDYNLFIRELSVQYGD